LILERAGTAQRGAIEVKGGQRPIAAFELAAFTCDEPCPQHRRGLDVQIGDTEGVGLDEVAAGLDEVAHQGREGLLGRVGVADLDLQERADFRVERRFL
jgi:hypothetical protein